jgi:hypothetical protein
MSNPQFKPGDSVIWDNRLHTVIEWQPTNGTGCYWLQDDDGNSATAGPDEVTAAKATYATP